MTNKVFFHYADKKLAIKNKSSIKSFIPTIFEKERRLLKRINYIFCSDEYLRNINLQYLQHDYYTDIITFDLSEGDETIGEVYISIDRVVDNAQSNKVTLLEEHLRVIFHGSLHLCGYKDKTKKDEKTMREKEDEYIALYLKTVSHNTVS